MEQQNQLIRKSDSELVTIQDRLQVMLQQKDSTFARQKIPQSYDLLSKYIALKEVIASDKTGAASKMGWGITLLFLLFELIPSIMKLLLPQTEYDVLVIIRRRLNIKAAKKIYDDAQDDYAMKNAAETSLENPATVEKIFRSQSNDIQQPL